MEDLSSEIITRLEKEKNIWFASVRPGSKPHLVPVWFIWEAGSFYICTSHKSIKYHNISNNPEVSLALEDGVKPVICEGTAEVIERPWPEEITLGFKRKYDWEIETDQDYDALVQILPQKWLVW